MLSDGKSIVWFYNFTNLNVFLNMKWTFFRWVRLWRDRYGRHWIISVAGSLLACDLILLQREGSCPTAARFFRWFHSDLYPENHRRNAGNRTTGRVTTQRWRIRKSSRFFQPISSSHCKFSFIYWDFLFFFCLAPILFEVRTSLFIKTNSLGKERCQKW